MTIPTEGIPDTVVYPESDGKPTGETEVLVELLAELFLTLRAHLSDLPDLYVGAALLIYYKEGKPRKRVVPDLFAARGVGRHHRKSWLMWKEGKAQVLPDASPGRLRPRPFSVRTKHARRLAIVPVEVYFVLIDNQVKRIPMTKEEFFRLAGDATLCLRDWEEGIAIQMGPAHSRHGVFAGILLTRLRDFLRPGQRGNAWTELFVDFGDRTFGVDLAVLFAEHLDRHVNGRIQGYPDIVIEVLSPDSVQRDRVEKFDAYHQNGVPWYWIGDAEAGILEEFHSTPEGYVRRCTGTLQRPFEPDGLPGFSVPLRDLMD